MPRNRPSTPCLGKQLDILFARGLVKCCECGEQIRSRKECDWDHRAEYADTKDDSIGNYGPIHNRKTADNCHKFKSVRAEKQRSHIDRLEKLLIQQKEEPSDPSQETSGEVARQSPRRSWGSRPFPKRETKWPTRKMCRKPSKTGISEQSEV